MHEKLYVIHRKFNAIIKLVTELDQSPRRFGTDEVLSHSEVHLIEIIGDGNGLSVTEIAHRLGVTKGAVSQSLKKLEAKEYTRKEADPANLSRAMVSLEPKGETVYHAHKEWHEKMDGGYSRYMKELPEEDLEVIISFMEKTEDFLKRRLESPE